MSVPAILALEDGSLFHGIAVGTIGYSSGEVVFNTSMTGYQEILTDPSYCRQLITLTYPHIGNTGTNNEDFESDRVHAAGLIIRDLPDLYSSWRAEQSLQSFLEAQQVVAIAEIDTRRLTRILREKGAQAGCIAAGDKLDFDMAIKQAKEFPGLRGMDLAREVTTDALIAWDEGGWDLESGYLPAADRKYHVVAYDFGVKRNILRMLSDRGCRVTVVPATTPASDVLAMKPDGVFLSNGPGDPEPCDYAIASIKEIVATDTPVFGICLGHQLLALASGAQTEKMKFGHHGANHPVQDLASKHVMITSQNHGFAVAEGDLPENLRVTHRSLFDKSIQGIECMDHPAFSFQGHPEASPGPHDVSPLFDRFIENMIRNKSKAKGTDS
ncbi:carbamoyl-phosphate synthase small chain [bacterium BMS3Bbin11]|nr:carbamoyl-phosphate synthase small chain [bacterium BMS3Abin11]GBE45182.1 carbamoyl-phosphate synthase small chain [bacterium BMS3Bbin11]GMT41373.1 MAG: carbamoyl-phosphate synthase small chain [bacterium]HDH16214.1 carbamoyl-phosphate synthase small subunit [Gammaproteobacteria bacterium]HDZ78285.1 carbamoyl-phosphate synthase small subunit [Gammaproteobacteria bacterium]